MYHIIHILVKGNFKENRQNSTYRQHNGNICYKNVVFSKIHGLTEENNVEYFEKIDIDEASSA
jgi:hypothetical protein